MFVGIEAGINRGRHRVTAIAFDELEWIARDSRAVCEIVQ